MKTTYFYLIIAVCLFVGMVVLSLNEHFITGIILGVISSIMCGYCIAKLTTNSHA